MLEHIAHDSLHQAKERAIDEERERERDVMIEKEYVANIAWNPNQL